MARACADMRRAPLPRRGGLAPPARVIVGRCLPRWSGRERRCGRQGCRWGRWLPWSAELLFGMGVVEARAAPGSDADAGVDGALDLSSASALAIPAAMQIAPIAKARW